MLQVAFLLKLANEQVVNKRYCSSPWKSISLVKWFNNLIFNSMFDELKEVKYLNRNNRFQQFDDVKCCKEIKCLKSVENAEAYLEPK